MFLIDISVVTLASLFVPPARHEQPRPFSRQTIR